MSELARLVDLRGGGDQADVAERLREVAELLPIGRVNLLRQQAEIVRVARELLEQRLRALELAGLREARDEPERADHERALLASQTVRVQALLVAVAEHEPVLGEPRGDRVDRRAQAPVRWPAGS